MSSPNEELTKKINGVKVFSATKYRERGELGNDITNWLRANKHVEVIERVVTQSSDAAFHCLTITLFYHDPTDA